MKEGPVTAHSPRLPHRKVVRPPALLPLISICLSELRRDIARLFASHWAEAPRRRTRELLTAIEQACDRQRLDAMAILARSMLNLTGLPQKEAVSLGSALRATLEELLAQGDRLVSEELNRQTA